MEVIEYFVMRRAGQWWVMRDAARTGPFLSEKAAVESAVGHARLDFKIGRSARVSVDEPDDGIPVVYDSSAP